MTHDDNLLIRADLGPDAPDDLVALAERLHRERPLPNPTFRGDLGRRLQARAGRMRDPGRARLLIARFSFGGTFLLFIGAFSAAGVGPLGT